MMSLEQIQAALQAALPGCQAEIVGNPSPAGQPSLWIDNEHARAAAEYLRDSADLRLDYCSNVSGVDWPGQKDQPGYLEAVYHLYSVELKQGPVILRLRTADRGEGARLPSLTPVWRAAEFQEREILDLYGIVFAGHPDPRRLLMWEEFTDHPMRKDYVPPSEDEPAGEASRS